MKLRHLLTTTAVTALAVTPLAFAGAANGAFDAHSKTFNDTTEDQHIVGTIDIQKVHLYRNTKSDFVAVVTYKDLVRRPATKWIVTFQDFSTNDSGRSASQQLGVQPRGVAMEYRIGPDNKTAAFGYQYDLFSVASGADPKPMTCSGFAAKANFTADTITYTIPEKCWTVRNDPANVAALTRLFKPSEWRSNFQSYYTEEPNRTDDAYSDWSWGGTPVPSDVSTKPGLKGNPFWRR